MTNRTKAYLALITASIIDGLSYPVMKSIFSLISPSQFLFLRYLVNTLLVFPILIYYLFKLKPSFTTIIKVIALEVMSYISIVILYQGLDLTSSIETSLINAIQPILIIVGGIIFLKEKEEEREWKGLIISFLGTLILIIHPLLTHQSSIIHNFSLKGNLLVLIYNIIIVTYLILVKKIYQKLPKMFILTISYPIALTVMYASLKLQNLALPLHLLHNTSVLMTVAYMSIFSSFIGFSLYLYGQSKIEVSEATLFTYLTSVIAIPASMLLLKETVNIYQVIAIIIISMGVFIGEYLPKRLAKKDI